MTDFVRAARNELASYTDIKNLVGSGEGFDTWIFREDKYVSLEGTGEALIVLSQNGGWAAPNAHNTAKFPRLQVEIFVDPARDSDLQPVLTTPHERARELVTLVDAVFHIPEGGEIEWDNELRVLGSKKQSEEEITFVPDGDKMVRALVYYEVSLG